MAIAPVLSIAATGLGAIGSVTSGIAKSDADDYQAQQAEKAAQIGKIKAAQTDTIMRQNLMSSLANIQAVRASSGTDPSSPTGNAILARQQAIGDETRQQRVANIDEQVSSDQNAAAFYQSSASNALLGGFLGAAGDIAKAATGGVSSTGFMGPGSGMQNLNALGGSGPVNLGGW